MCTSAWNVTKYKLVHFCTGFTFCTFDAIMADRTIAIIYKIKFKFVNYQLILEGGKMHSETGVPVHNCIDGQIYPLYP